MGLKPKAALRSFTGQRSVDAQQNAGAAALQAFKGNLLATSTILSDDPDWKNRGIKPNSGMQFNAGEVRLLAHGLGQPYTGVRVAQYRGGTPGTVQAVSLPLGANAGQYINVVSGTQQAIDLEVY